jgi:hypothetical protein
VIAGRTVLTGGPSAIFAVAALVALAFPAAFVAVTIARTVSPTWLVISRYVELVAPAMFEQLAPELLHSCH